MPVFKSINNISHSYGGLKNVINYITSGEKERIYKVPKTLDDLSSWSA